jgi:2-oxoglutarate ferredoxin oxidoreductase subunit alpha
LVLGWGSTAGTVRAAVQRVRGSGERVATAHLRWLNPMPTNTGEVLGRYPKVLIPEINEGQLALLLRAKFLVDARSFSRVQGRPIWADELDDAIAEALRG